MDSSESIKAMVRQKYSEIAQQGAEENKSSCCGAGGCSTEVYNIMTDDYTGLEGYNADADLGLGCGLPTEFAGIRAGFTVIDLGSGAGNDAFVARAQTGAGGKVIGIDFTPAMVAKARLNAEKLGFSNVEFREGDIENIPAEDGSADVVVSNCVLNLVPNKAAVLADIYRVLRPGAHFSISDIVLQGGLPAGIQEAAEMYAGCVSGAILKAEYLRMIYENGFIDVVVQKEKEIIVPDDILSRYLDTDGIQRFRHSGSGIFSITVFGRKPFQE